MRGIDRILDACSGRKPQKLLKTEDNFVAED